jgi:hypothetical protein
MHSHIFIELVNSSLCMTDEGEAQSSGIHPHQIGFADQLLPREKRKKGIWNAHLHSRPRP